MNKINVIEVFLFIFTLSGCAGMDVEHVTGNYYLTRMDYSDENLDVSYYLGNGNYIGVVNPTVFAIGFNDDFIIAKQHPENFNDSTRTYIIDKSTTYYFIIPLKYRIHNSPDENVIGPLTYEEFMLKREELNISSDLRFTKTFKQLE